MTQQPKTCEGRGHYKSHHNRTQKIWHLLVDHFAKHEQLITATCQPEELSPPIGKVPQIGDSIFIGHYFFYCTASNTGQWLGVYEIKLECRSVAKAYLSYDNFWYHNQSDSNFGTPHEIVIDLDATRRELS